MCWDVTVAEAPVFQVTVICTAMLCYGGGGGRGDVGNSTAVLLSLIHI